MSKVLVDRELLEYLADLGDEAIERMGSYLAEKHGEQKYVDAARAILAQPAEAEGVRDYLAEFAEGEIEARTAIEELLAALSAVTAERDLAVQGGLQIIAERDRLRDAAGKAIAWLDAEQNGSGVGINRRIKLCRDAENSLRAAMAAKEA